MGYVAASGMIRNTISNDKDSLSIKRTFHLNEIPVGDNVSDNAMAIAVFSPAHSDSNSNRVVYEIVRHKCIMTVVEHDGSITTNTRSFRIKDISIVAHDIVSNHHVIRRLNPDPAAVHTLEFQVAVVLGDAVFDGAVCCIRS